MRRWAPEHLREEMRRDEFTSLNAHEYERHLTQLDQEERSWSQNVYIQMLIQVTRETQKSSSTIKLTPEMEAQILAKSAREVAQRLNSSSLYEVSSERSD